MTFVECHQNADDTVQGRQRVADADAYPHRYPARLGGQMTQTTHGLGNDTKAWLVAIGAGLTVAADPKDNQFWISGQQIKRVQPKAFHRTGPKILDQHIGVHH